MSDFSPRRFVATLDLTTRAREQGRNTATDEDVQPDDALPSISIEDLSPRLRTAVDTAGWPGLMPVQQRAIPYLLKGRDLIVQSKTGSGKTGAFLLPIFAGIDPDEKKVQALIMAPTRELARQIHEEFVRLTSDRATFGGLDAALVYGGVRYQSQNDALRGGAQVVIGTPGRILDHLERRTFTLDALRTLVLDEADEMLSMGFYPAMKRLLRYLPRQRQSTLFSATMPPRVRALAREFLDQPEFLALSAGNVNVDTIDHRYYVVPGLEKDRVLVRLIELENPDSAIIFANTRREVEYLTRFLRNYGHDAGEISGDLSQNAREQIMQRIRDGHLRFLVATDVAARGIDISDLSHVVQYDVPQDPEYYVHRAGRTARAGKTGTALSLITYEEKSRLLGIARRYDIPMEEHPIPSEADVQERLSERLTELLESQYRDKSNLERERSARFESLVLDLAKEEPQLLAMLLDELYHRQMHRAAAPELAQQERLSDTPPPASEAPKKRRSGRNRPRDSQQNGGSPAGQA